MDIRHLIILNQVALSGSITKAAAALNTSQPSLTRALQQLEHKAGVPLLVRTRRGTALTEPAEALVRHVRSIQAELRRAEDGMIAFKTMGAERIAVGTMPAGSSKLVPEALLRFQRAYPQVAISVYESTRELPEMVERGELDLAIMSLPVDSHTPGLTDETLVYNKLVVVARHGHPLLRRRQISLQNLVEAEWMLPMITGKPREEFENAFWRHGIEPPRRMLEIGSARTLRTLLLDSDKVAPMVRLSIIDEESRGLLAVLPIELDLPVRRVSLLMRKGVRRSQALETFVATLREVGRDLADWPLVPRRATGSSRGRSLKKRAS